MGEIRPVSFKAAFKKEIIFSGSAGKRVTVLLFPTKDLMNRAYWDFRSEDRKYYVLGCHVPRRWYKVGKSGWKSQKKTGTVFLCYEYCGAGVVSHEFLHAAMYAFRHTKLKGQQYPFEIKTMDQEEKFLRMHTSVVTKFYVWFFSIQKELHREYHASKRNSSK